MTAIVKTNTIINDTNLVDNKDTFIYVARKKNASQLLTNWKNKEEILWKNYNIKETDMRVKTATFTTPQYLDLTTGQFVVLITSKLHENFGGVIISVEYDEENELYTYQCQDFSRVYQSKVEMVFDNIKLHRVLQFLITHGAYPLSGNISASTKKAYKEVLSGLRPAWQYSQKEYGSTINFNPMDTPITGIFKDKSYIELIRTLVYSTGAYIDVYFDKYGILHIKPYHKDDFFNSGLIITTPEIAESKYKFDTTNIQTGVIVSSNEQLEGGNFYSSKSLIGLDLTAFFGRLTTSVSNPNTKKTSTGKSTSGKKSVTTKNKDNPYGTKKKEVWVSMDKAGQASTDNAFIKNVCKELKKNGWKAHNIGRNTEAHHKYRDKAKNGVWLMLFNGVDPGVLRYANDPWFRTPLVKNNARMVIGFHAGACNIRKGGKCYKHVGKAWDDGYSGRNTALNYPLRYLTNHAVPVLYAPGYDYKKLVASFLAGGVNPEACDKNWKFKGTGYWK